MYSSLVESLKDDDEAIGSIVEDLICFASINTLNIVCEKNPQLVYNDKFWIICIDKYYKSNSTNPNIVPPAKWRTFFL